MNEKSQRSVVTPLLRIEIQGGPVFAKLEHQQSAGSVKGRAGYLSVAAAVKANPDITAVTDATSGNWGIAAARAAADYRLESIFFLPEALADRAKMIRREGAQVIMVEGGMPKARDAAAFYAREDDSIAYLNQFGSQLSVEAHAKGTAVEVAHQLPQHVRRLRVVAGSGTGATLAGLSRGLKEQGFEVEPWVARPITGSGLFSELVPGITDRISTFIDWVGANVVEVDESDAIHAARMLISKAINIGLSSGLNLEAARLLLRSRPNFQDEAIVTVFADHAREYRESHPRLFQVA